MKAKMLYVHALSPLHPGTGQGVGTIDLPVAREKATNIPYLPGSSIKGTLRDACQDSTLRTQLFGPETSSSMDHAGALQLGDARLLLFPVRSVAGTFTYATSPYILRRFARDAKMVNPDHNLPDLPEVSSAGDVLVTDGTVLKVEGKVYLEDLDLTPQENATEWAQYFAEKLFPGDSEWQKVFKQRFCILHDDVMGFLLETATEVRARVRIDDDTKTVVQGALWYEESLPAETVLYSLVQFTPNQQTNLNGQDPFAKNEDMIRKPLQFGGKATVGRGICQLRLV